MQYSHPTSSETYVLHYAKNKISLVCTLVFLMSFHIPMYMYMYYIFNLQCAMSGLKKNHFTTSRHSYISKCTCNMCMPRAPVGQQGSGLRPAGLPVRPDSLAWQAKLVEIIVYKFQSFIMLRYTMSINEACPSVSTIPIPSAQRLKSVSNPDLWEYNPKELVRFTPLQRFNSIVVVQTHPQSGLISRSIHQMSTQIKHGVITATGRSPGNTPLV